VTSKPPLVRPGTLLRVGKAGAGVFSSYGIPVGSVALVVRLTHPSKVIWFDSSITDDGVGWRLNHEPLGYGFEIVEDGFDGA
jgi:hypothetical protein